MDYFDFLDVLEDISTVPKVDDMVFAFMGGGGKGKGKVLPIGSPGEQAAAISEISRRQSQ
jgi:hypothetical protein